MYIYIYVYIYIYMYIYACIFVYVRVTLTCSTVVHSQDSLGGNCRTVMIAIIPTYKFQ